MAGVGVPQPVRAHGRLEPGARRRALQQAQHSPLDEPAAALAAGEHGIAGASVAAKGQQGSADALGQENLAHHSALADDGKLHLTLLAGQHIRPRQNGELGDPQASGIENLEEDTIALRPSAAHQQQPSLRA